jgi:hypothetical protein
MVKRRIFFLVLVMLLTAGCGDYWASEGVASRTQAEARLRQADAANANARAAIIDAEARGALAQSQAGALTQAMTINSDLTRQAVLLADKSEYVLALGAMALGAMLLALVVVVRHGGPSPATTREQPRAVILLETADGRVLRLVQEPGESLAAFEAQAEALTAPDAMRLLAAPNGRGVSKSTR